MRRAVALTLLFAGCGGVVFVDPDAALKRKLQFGLVERLIVAGDPRAYLHVRIESRDAIDRIELSVSSVAGVFSVPLDQANVQPCGRGETCLSITLGPGLPEDADQIVLSVPDIGHVATGAIVVRRLEAHAVFAEAKAQNTQAAVTVVDPIRRFYADTELVIDVDADGNETVRGNALLFPRAFEVRAHAGACSGESDPSDPSWQAVEGSPFDANLVLSSGDDPLGCAELRPTLPPHGPMVAFTTITPRAQVVTFRHTYTPPVESSPMVYVPFFDLELPNAERCAEAQNLIRSAVDEAATRIAQRQDEGAEILGLPSVQIAEHDGVPCRQTNNRSFSASAVADDIRAALLEAFGPTRRVRVLLVYVANLEIGLSPTLDFDFQQLVDAFRGPGSVYQTFTLAIAPESAASTLEANRQIAWIATEEPSFRDTITNVLSEIWPFRTSIHTSRTVVPLLPADQIGRFPFYRICASQAHQVRGIGTPASSVDNGVLIVGPDGPSYRVPALSAQILVERQSFVIENVVVEWQGCERLCDRPAPGGDPAIPWLDTPDC